MRIGPQIGMRIGTGRSSAPGVWTSDATSGKALPANATEAAALLSAAGISAATLALYHFGVPASGNVSDLSGNGKTLTVSGNIVNPDIRYQQNVAGWTAKSFQTTVATVGKAVNNTFGNVNANSYTVITYAQLTAGAAVRTIMRFGNTFNDDACLEMTAGELLSVGEGDGTRTNGVSTINGQVRPLVLRIDDGTNQVDGFTDAEKVVGGTQGCNGTELCFGGDNVQTNHPATCDYIFAWVLNTAPSDGQLRNLLTEAGWTIAW